MELGPQLETRLKENLYRCLEEIKATRAALYLLDEDGSFEVVTQYGFRRGLRDRVQAKDEIVDNLLVRRSAYYINSLAEDHRFSEFLYEADTSRILVSPIHSRGKLVGFIDMRDKAASREFDSEDLKKSAVITEDFLKVFLDEGMYGQRKIAVDEIPGAQQKVLRGRNSRPALLIADRATAEVSRGIFLERRETTRGIDEKMATAAGVLPAFLNLRSIAIAAVSGSSETSNELYVVSRGEVPEEALEQFKNRLGIWLRRRGEELPHFRTKVDYPFGTREYRVTPERIKNLLAAPVRAAEPHSMVLSVVFDQKPDDEVRGHLEQLHQMLEQVVDNAGAAERLRSLREKVAMGLLEPDLEVHPDLILHARRVSELSVDLARKVGLSSAEIEDVRVAALVHDVGLRPLGYSSNQRGEELSEGDLQVVRQHPLVGGVIVARSALGPEIGRIVYHHQERVDGTGYPESLPADRIPLASKIIHLCESYDAMTSQHSYKNPLTQTEALSRIRAEAGKQFDPGLVGTFCAMIENS